MAIRCLARWRSCGRAALSPSRAGRFPPGLRRQQRRGGCQPRERKARDEKPFAVMLANVASAANLGHIGIGEPALLESPERPVVLLKKRHFTDERLPGWLPTRLAWRHAALHAAAVSALFTRRRTPERHCLADAAAPLRLVMTSANPGGEPLVTGNDEALERLSDIADAFLIHDRDIVVRRDDWCNAGAGRFQFIPGTRLYTPRAIAALRRPIGAGAGGYFKNTICVTRQRGLLSAAHRRSRQRRDLRLSRRTVAHLLDVLQVNAGTRRARFAPRFRIDAVRRRFRSPAYLPAVPVQHHHAHLMSVMAEHGIRKSTLGLAA